MRYLKRLEFIDFLTRKKATGNLEVFAAKNRLSKNGLHNVLKDERNGVSYKIQQNFKHLLL